MCVTIRSLNIFLNMSRIFLTQAVSNECKSSIMIVWVSKGFILEVCRSITQGNSWFCSYNVLYTKPSIHRSEVPNKYEHFSCNLDCDLKITPLIISKQMFVPNKAYVCTQGCMCDSCTYIHICLTLEVQLKIVDYFQVFD